MSELVTKDYLHTEMQGLRVEISRELRAQMLWFFAMQIAVVSAALALFKLLP